MKRFGYVPTLLGAASLLLLTACKTGPEPPRAVLVSGVFSGVPEKTRLFVVGNFTANFGTNGSLFRDRFLDMAQQCHVTVDYFEMPAASDQLTLDPDPKIANAQAELQRRLAAFQPDGILEVDTTGWQGAGGLSSTPSAPVYAGTFSLKLRLLDGKKRTEQWHATGSLIIKSGTGGELLAPVTLQRLISAGALPHCPQ